MDDAASAADIAALQRTIRRCTALLVVVVGVHLAVVTPGSSDWGALLATAAGFYLFASVTDLEGSASESGDGGADDGQEGDGTDADADDGDETDSDGRDDGHEEGSAVRSDAGG
ncbi:hypothetical protein [Halosimplex halophilum]|uniref:hypothetical protein n=1 Tax=Halosimplex halophilum TaxID=2559572 RepID=UPI00107FBA43|nr:hypothetical protein [Halosimplex halophilum]